MKLVVLTLLFSTLVGVAQAQVDPSTLAIIRSESNKTAEKESASKRYEIRPKKYKEPKADIGDSEENTLPEDSTGTPDLGTPVKSVDQATTLPDLVPRPEDRRSGDENSIGGVRDLIMGGSPEMLDEYRNYLPPDDLRRNLLDFTVAPFYVYNDSRSPYWYRNYLASAPGVLFAADVWFTPMFGLEASYRRTVSGDVRTTPGTEDVTSLSQEWVGLGLRFRRFFGFNEKASSLVLGIDYSEYQFRVPPDETSRIRLRSAGPRFSVEARIPKNGKQQSTIGVDIYPWPQHTELPTGVNVLSGIQNESFGFAVSTGEEYKLSRTQRVFWKVTIKVEKSLYTGGANAVDPLNGQKPTTVPVTNTFGFFDIGITWGK